jgi:DNA-binding transcriptional ArsR family regulator
VETVGQAADQVIDALADPMRRRILDELARLGEATATLLAGALPVSRQAVVKHLAVLDTAGLVLGRRAGRERRYQVRPAALHETARWLDQVAEQWDRRLRAVRRFTEDRPPG